MSKLIVGVGDMKLSNDPGDTIITYALGSCLGMVIFDQRVKVGGILHVMLPDSAINAKDDAFNPFKYVNAGVPLFFKEAYKLGANKPDIMVKIAGCAQIADDNGFFNIGKRNYAAAQRLLWKNNVLVKAEHCGDVVSRTVSLEISTGKMMIQIGNERFEL